MLLLSDLGKPGQNALLAAYPDLKADIVVSGLPTQGEPLADALLAALHPALIVVTDSEYPASQRASAKLRTRLEASGVAVWYTHQAGAVSLSFKEGKWSMTSMQGERQSGGAAQ